MGLAVSQVRLLALTSRKADIELQMQVNSKRKQMLTRKSTELSQTYYNKLQDSNIKYATSNGFEDVDYSFLMGETQNNKYTNDFLKQICYAPATKNIAQKSENNMILTNQYGQVIVNNQMGAIIAKVNEAQKGSSTAEKVAAGIYELIYQNSGGYNVNDNVLSGMKQFFMSQTSGGKWDVDYDKRQKFIDNLERIIKNGGYQNGGTVYVHGTVGAPTNTSKFYRTPEDAKDEVNWIYDPFQDGYVYNVNCQDGSSAIIGDGSSANGYLCVDSSAATLADKFDTAYEKTYCEYMGNLVAYFAPIISAALQNGTSASGDVVTCTPDGSNSIPDNGTNKYKGRVNYTGAVGDTEAKKRTYAQTALPNAGDMGYLTMPDGTILGYYWNKDGTVQKVENRAKFYDMIQFYVKKDGNAVYDTAANTKKLQTGFKSSIFQLAMVSDPSKGIYHKNTSMTYFTHMNYVVDKMDTSKKEEITAWFNKEQAAISEQETYWDAEIQNLSTELNSVTQEIESVKQLKSNSVKSVFNWANG